MLLLLYYHHHCYVYRLAPELVVRPASHRLWDSTWYVACLIVKLCMYEYVYIYIYIHTYTFMYIHKSYIHTDLGLLASIGVKSGCMSWWCHREFVLILIRGGCESWLAQFPTQRLACRVKYSRGICTLWFSIPYDIILLHIILCTDISYLHIYIYIYTHAYA